MTEQSRNVPPRSFWVISAAALVWNLLGVVSYLTHVTIGEQALAAMAVEERALMEQFPAWAIGAFAVAVFGGVLGALGLLLRQSWALPVFVVSLLAIIAQDVHWLLMTDSLKVHGIEAIAIPALVLVLAIFEIWYARRAKSLGFLG